MIREEDQRLLIALVKKNIITNEQLQNFIQTSENSINLQGIVQTLIRKFQIQEDIIAQIIAEEFNIPFLYATEGQNWIDVPELPEEASSKYRFIPIIIEDLEITVAFIDPPYKRIINLIETTTRREVVPVVITVTAFDNLIAKKSKKLKKDQGGKFDFDKLDVEIRGEKWANSVESATKFPAAGVIFTRLLDNAEFFKATEMHLETTKPGHLRIKLRIDGILQRVVTLPQRLTNPMFSLISHMEEGYKKSWDTGEFQIKHHNNKLTLHYYSLSTVNGIKMVINLPKKDLEIFSMEDLGYSEHDLEKTRYLISRTPGLVIISGPAFSGKTSTYYSILNELNAAENNIISLEYKNYHNFDKVTQITIEENIKKQDKLKIFEVIKNLKPDYFFLQRIVDSADIEFIQDLIASNVKVISIYPGNDSIKTVIELKNITSDYPKLIDNLKGVISQRLIRKICTSCSIKYRPDDDVLEKVSLLNLPEDIYITRGEGCPDCDGTGYNKITPLSEVLILTEELKEIFIQNLTYESILFEAQKNGFTNLRYDGIRKILRGVTTIDEVLRVT